MTRRRLNRHCGIPPYLFKSDEMVVRRWEIISNASKRTYWVRATTNEDPFVEQDTTDKFRRYYTVSQKNYPLEGHHHLPNATLIEVDARQ